MTTQPPWVIRAATPADRDGMALVEVEARALLAAQGVAFDQLSIPDGFAEDVSWDLAVVAVAEGEVVGMARCTALTPSLLCLDQVSVRPALGRQGLGTQLLTATCTIARRAGFQAVTGTTFADVVINGPFYRRLGAVEDPQPHPQMLSRRAVERALGLDAFGRRIIMRLPL